MTLVSGIRFGVYEIIAPIGAGGMGEVYRARDTRLGRTVAVKVLPEAFARDRDRLGRFAREAKVLASLNHPNIAAIYDFEDSGDVPVLVMEFVEGPTLADHLLRSPMSLTDAMQIVKQICEALEYAHERGIVHRDLKPANVKITPEGVVKLLDFGLAKALCGEIASRDPGSSPTITDLATQDGIILGTAAYMSPEQAKGKSADRRSDIWAFGCLFYEMLTAQRAFAGESIADTLASVLKTEPDWSLLPPRTPFAMRALIQRCLKRDPKGRLQAIGDARIAIEEAISAPDKDEALPSPAQPRPIWRRTLPWAAAFVTGAVLAGIGFLILAISRPHSSAMHFRAVTNFSGVQSHPALSPDGRSVAFVSNRDGHYNIYVGLLNGANPVKLTDDANLKTTPCWSPDGTEIAYGRLNDSGIWDIWKVPALGGTSRRLILNASDPAWSRDGRWMAYRTSTGAIWISDASGQGGRELARAQNELFGNSGPRFSPDGRKVAYAASLGGPAGELEIVDVESGRIRRLTHDDASVVSPAWSADGRFIYFASSRGGTLNIWKIADKGGEPEQITTGQGDDAQPDISADGKRIVFSTFRSNVNLAELDLRPGGQKSPGLLIADLARSQYAPAYSPDGKHLAYFSVLKGVEREGIWLANSDGSAPVPLVQDQEGAGIFPRWTRDSAYLVYVALPSLAAPTEFRRISIYGGAPQTLLRNVSDFSPDIDSSGQLLFKGPHGEVQISSFQGLQTLITLPSDQFATVFRWSPDHQSVAYMVNPTQEGDPRSGVWVFDRNGPPRQVFRGWVTWYAWGPGNEIYLIQAKPDLEGVLWKVDRSGRGLGRVPLSIPLPLDYWYPVPSTEFDISPDGRHLAFTAQEVLQANIGMLENIQ